MSTTIQTATIPPENQPVGWDVIDAAVYDWLNDLLEFDDRIIWENLGEVQPAYPYISLLRGTTVSEGGLNETRMRTLAANGDVVTDQDLQTAFENEEISYEPILFTVTVQCNMDQEAGRNDPLCNSMALLGKAKASLSLRSVLDKFSAAGMSVVRDENVLDTSLVVNSGFISRATLDVIFRTASVMAEKVGFADKVQLISDALGVDTIVDGSL